MITVNHITKRFGATIALNDADLTVDSGRILGLVGSNGAGKSTLMRIIAGIYRQDSGEMLVTNQSVWEHPAVKSRVFYISDDPYFISSATVSDMGRFYGAHYPAYSVAKLRTLCDELSLKMDQKIAATSRGTQKRIALALALSTSPAVLLCDETFDGLDPVMREVVKRLLGREMLERGMTTILASHSMRELEDICDSVGLIHEGRILFARDVEDIAQGVHKIQCAFARAVSREDFPQIDVLRMETRGSLCVITARGALEDSLRIINAKQPLFVESLPLGLEEIFVLEMEGQGYGK